ncbi:FAD dependent oxidoreductase [Aureobasidium sp. EXF-12298]|nr:FAD dependent oxidoreductase [Aureobasidium sp. EXF-12298]KAI4758455.1 FAD dependent oxidoreductase [Aureobasidium sp. EXF-12344]KAI4777117.1 FAD dependent oxidoreductase [Aureobasidium sp. EXF-3400]
MSNNIDQDLTIIIGAGIVGSSLACFLFESTHKANILVLDRSLSTIAGSTGYAPGFIGQYNERPSLTKLAIESVRDYAKLATGFARNGGLEIASTDAGIKMLHSRLEACRKTGLSARLLDEGEIKALDLPIADLSSATKALFFPDDGVAEPKLLCSAYRDMAASNGVSFKEASVSEIAVEGNTITGVILKNGELLPCQKLVLATASLLQRSSAIPCMPVVPVSHPYVYAKDRQYDVPPTPFMRWPESHVYSRDHGSRYGVGTYDHPPQKVARLGDTATVPWSNETFNPAMTRAISSRFTPGAGLSQEAPFGAEKVGGVFSVTPDNMPLLGPVAGIHGLWMAVAIWVTHAAGCARMLEKMMLGKAYDEEIARDLDPARFAGGNAEELERTALKQYNDIYNTDH